MSVCLCEWCAYAGTYKPQSVSGGQRMTSGVSSLEFYRGFRIELRLLSVHGKPFFPQWAISLSLELFWGTLASNSSCLDFVGVCQHGATLDIIYNEMTKLCLKHFSIVRNCKLLPSYNYWEERRAPASLLLLWDYRFQCQAYTVTLVQRRLAPVNSSLLPHVTVNWMKNRDIPH